MPEHFREDLFEPDRKELAEGPAHRFELGRREWIGALGVGLFVSACGRTAHSQDIEATDDMPQATRLHLGEDGTITVLTGKVEFGQGSRTQILQVASEELKVSREALRVVLADTAVTPDDGSTAGSRTTPSTVPVVRRACSAARELLLRTAAEEWGVEMSVLKVEEGAVSRNGRTLAYRELARSKRMTATADSGVPRGVAWTPVEQWAVLGRSMPKTLAAEIVTGRHRYPSDIVRPQMLYGAVLRAPSYGAKLESVDLTPAREMGAVAVHDGDFVGCAAKTSYAARQALAAVAKTARWRESPQPSSDGIGAYLNTTCHHRRRRPQRSPNRRNRRRGQGAGGPQAD